MIEFRRRIEREFLTEVLTRRCFVHRIAGKSMEPDQLLAEGDVAAKVLRNRLKREATIAEVVDHLVAVL